MPNEIVTQPDSPDDDHHNRSGDDRSSKGRRRKRDRLIYSRSQCLELLTQLPGMIKAGFLLPIEAKAIQSTLQTILAEHRLAQRSNSSPTSLPADLRKLVRERPELQSWFEPLMSEEDIQSLMDENDN